MLTWKDTTQWFKVSLINTWLKCSSTKEDRNEKQLNSEYKVFKTQYSSTKDSCYLAVHLVTRESFNIRVPPRFMKKENKMPLIHSPLNFIPIWIWRSKQDHSQYTLKLLIMCISHFSIVHHINNKIYNDRE